MEKLKTSRLMLRRFLESDRMQMIRILRNEEIRKTFMLPDFGDDEAAGTLFDRIFINSQSDAHYERAVCLEDRVIGFVNDVEIRDGTVELGYVIHPDYQGRGYATEVLTAAIWELFQRGYHTVQAGYFEDNPASGRVMEKSGMHPISKTEDITYRGIVHHCLYFELENPIKKLGTHIRYLPAVEDPLSAEVYLIQGEKYTYLFDVGNNTQSLLAIQSLPNPPIAILSHHHADHTGNALKTDFKKTFVGEFTREKLGIGTAVTEPLTIEDGIFIEIIPCPSVHTPGSLILNVNREYCLIGDLFFYKPPVSSDLARQMMDTLTQVDTRYFVVSHSGTENKFDKKTFLLELQREFV